MTSLIASARRSWFECKYARATLGASRTTYEAIVGDLAEVLKRVWDGFRPQSAYP
jgi:hypothetical protein